MLHLIHLVGRMIRNLAIRELIIGGDCWDRGPRGDKVVDYLRQQPNVSFIWGNHDISWLGASLGNDALICTVLRISLRYRRIGQLDEGYSIPLTPLEHLARSIYADDPANHFMPKSAGMRPMELVARMQKAIAIIQFKVEGQMMARNPHWNLDHRRLLHCIDQSRGYHYHRRNCLSAARHACCRRSIPKTPTNFRVMNRFAWIGFAIHSAAARSSMNTCDTSSGTAQCI